MAIYCTYIGCEPQSVHGADHVLNEMHSHWIVDLVVTNKQLPVYSKRMRHEGCDKPKGRVIK